MKKTVLLKRILFWLETGASALVVIAAAFIIGWVLVKGLRSEDMAAWMSEVYAIAAYFLGVAWKIMTTEALIVAATLFWVVVYVSTTLHFAQTQKEKKLAKSLVPLTLICLPVCVIAGFTMAVAGLASQGAGQ